MVFAITGGSSEAWGYGGWSSDRWKGYDDDARWLAGAFANAGVPAVTGASELVGLEIADSIGHVKPASKDIVFQAYLRWLRMCCLPRLPMTWSAMWDADASAFYYWNPATPCVQPTWSQPTLHPPVLVDEMGDWDAACTPEGDWYYVNRRDSREVRWGCTPKSVGDWKVVTGLGNTLSPVKLRWNHQGQREMKFSMTMAEA